MYKLIICLALLTVACAPLNAQKEAKEDVVSVQVIIEKFNNFNNGLVDQKILPLNKKYFLGSEKLSWYGADYFCKNFGWKLLSINNITIASNLRGFLNNYGINNVQYWTAGNRLYSNEGWVWGIAGEKFTFRDWSQNNGNRTGDCLYLAAGTAKWKNAQCYEERNFICQKVD